MVLKIPFQDELPNMKPKSNWMSFFFIVLSCLAMVFWMLFRSYNLFAVSDAGIEVCVQQSTGYERLSIAHLQEILNLSRDQLIKFAHFDVKAATKQLYALKCMRRVSVKKVRPNVLYIDYEMKEPFIILGNLSNTLIDEEGSFIPAEPFYASRKLPKLFLADATLFTEPIDQVPFEQFLLCKQILANCCSKQVLSIDLSQQKADSLGQRQIVVTLSDNKILRLTAKNYVKELRYYNILSEKNLFDKAKVFDFRNPGVVYVV